MNLDRIWGRTLNLLSDFLLQDPLTFRDQIGKGCSGAAATDPSLSEGRGRGNWRNIDVGH